MNPATNKSAGSWCIVEGGVDLLQDSVVDHGNQVACVTSTRRR
jgi:hypothetical protein